MWLTRRDALKLAACGLAAPAWAAPPSAQSAAVPTIPSWPTELRRLAPDVYAYTQATGPGVNNSSLSNAGVVAGPDGLLAIDALGPPVHARAFKAAAMQATGKPFTRVLNTHHHRDHTNGNCVFAPAELVASAFTRQATIDQGLPARPYEERPEWQDGMHELTLAPATVTFTDTLTWRYGDIEVQAIAVGPGHTWGDVVVYLPAQRILFAADLMFTYVTPPAHNGHITKWIEAIDRVMTLDADIVVPGHGPVGTRGALGETRAYLELMANETRKRYARGMTPGQAAADIDLGGHLGRFAGWTNPERNAWNTVRIYAELSGTITPANDTPAQNLAVAEYMKLRAARGSR